MKELTDEILSKRRDFLLEQSAKVKLDRYMGLEFLELSEGYALGRFPLTEEVMNPYGFTHGGSVLSLADTVAGNAASMYGKFVTTVNCNLNFMRPGMDTQYIYCECNCLREGVHLIVMEVKIKNDEGTVLDSGEFTYFKSDMGFPGEE